MNLISNKKQKNILSLDISKEKRTPFFDGFRPSFYLKPVRKEQLMKDRELFKWD